MMVRLENRVRSCAFSDASKEVVSHCTRFVALPLLPGCTYPAQLVNLPCPVEVHKTLDHASYYKAADVAQMLIVYEDALSFDEAQQEKPIEGFPSYYHSGLTPPMKGVVSKRFNRCYAARDRKALPPPRAAVADVEERLLELMEKLQKDEKGSGSGASTSKRSNKLPVLTSATKDLVEIEEEVVDYEEWMDDKYVQLCRSAFWLGMKVPI